MMNIKLGNFRVYQHAFGPPDIRKNAGGSAQSKTAPYENCARVCVLSTQETERAAGYLQHKDPFASAVFGVVQRQRIAFFSLSVLLVGLALIAPAFMAMALYQTLCSLFAISIVFRLIMLAYSFWQEPSQAAHIDDELPQYTILLALYQEADVLPGLCAAIDAFNYPKSKLDVKLILEADDEATILAASNMGLGRHWEILILPAIGPKTKPKALNAGFARARGSLVTIYDAEDRPHPDQLRHAVRAFARQSGQKLACVQAPLGYYNAAHNWLTRQFALEYAAHFRVLVPALSRLGLPFPLGGTSNHFRSEALRHVGAWDPYNVTEDADLGFRLSARGWKLGSITAPTMEEATSSLFAWRRQRSRWLKGYMQTMAVHMRRPAQHHGFAGAVSMAITLGTAVLSALVHASFLVLIVGSFIFGPAFNAWLAPGDYALAFAGFVSGVTILGVGAKRAGVSFSLLDLLRAAFYWPLQSWAMAKAIADLIVRPFHWEKTKHGVCASPEIIKYEQDNSLDNAL